MGISFILLTAAGISGAVTYSWVRDAGSVEGKVVELVTKRGSSKRGKGTTYSPRVRYSTEGGEREFVSKHGSGSPNFKVGDTVRVAVNPAKDKAGIATFGELYGFPIFGLSIGTAVAFATLVMMNGGLVLRMLHPNLRG